MCDKPVDLDVKFKIGDKLITIYDDKQGVTKSSTGIILAIRCILEIGVKYEMTFNLYKVNIDGTKLSIWLPEDALCATLKKDLH